jgi:deferrochelatase/peroxidase EfeB
VASLDLSDIQGNVLRAFKKRNARHFALRVGRAAQACGLLARMVSGNHDDCPQVTPASVWDARPRYCINLGVTAAGLDALALPQSLVALFPAAFRNGPAGNAAGIGDTEASAPERWRLGGPKNPAAHLLISLFTDESREACLEEMSARLRTEFAAHDLAEVWTQDAYTQPGDKVHFGYRDGIAQPRIKGASQGMRVDAQPQCEPGEFLLGCGYTNQFGGNFIGDLPQELAANGTYAALRLLGQNVSAFEDFIEEAGQRYNLHPEYVAAKLMGRWRNGAPLTLRPEPPAGSQPGVPTLPDVPDAQLTDFDYSPSAAKPAYYDDADGMRCPVGSHIRRLNPRSALVMGKPHSRRIIRRGMSYGPVYDPRTRADEAVERGLVGYFICGDLELQFEFLLQVWANMDMATTGIRGTRDPILGAQPEHGGQFVLRTDSRNDPVIFNTVPRWITTHGSLYVFMPGFAGLRFLGSLG